MKNILLSTLSLIAILSVMSIPNFEAFAEEEQTGYKIIEDVKSVVTFTFRDGVEVHEFPFYSMTTDFISNDGSTFKVQGVVGDAPHLHKALDELYKNRLVIGGLNAGFDYNYRFFDVNVDFLQDDEIFNSNVYYNCEILSYKTKTLNSKDYESYHSSKSGFATVDEIEFTCGGINSKKLTTMSMYENTQTDYATEPLPYSFAEDVRTYVTFDFDTGMERIEFHGFEINSGFGETGDAGPSFSVEHILQYYPLLENAIDIARKSSGVHTTYNIDFDVKVEFANTEKVLRELDYSDCRVIGEEIITLSDAEESFTGKSGFVLVHRVDFSCAGLSGNNPGYNALREDVPFWDTSMVSTYSPIHSYNVGTGATPIVTFTYAHGIEVINFPIFEQQNVLDRAYPSFTLTGIVGDFPMLYEKVDENLLIQNAQGASFVELFDVDVDLMYGEKSVRGFNYSNCRVIDYDVSSAMRGEESYIKGIFALENTFEIECLGYTPNNPAYDAMFETVKADNISTADLRDTQNWGSGFFVE